MLFACSSNNNIINKSSQYKSTSTEYLKAKEFFPMEYVNHFPERFDESSIMYSVRFTNDLGPISLYLINRANISESILNNYKKLSIASYSFHDSCLIINKYATNERFIGIQVTDQIKDDIIKMDSLNAYPIPNFFQFIYSDKDIGLWNFNQDKKLSKCNLPFDYKIFVIESKKGKYFNNNLLDKENFMPKSWEHGLSRGVAISKEDGIIIYWLNIW
jgi:hypothetical protein